MWSTEISRLVYLYLSYQRMGWHLRYWRKDWLHQYLMCISNEKNRHPIIEFKNRILCYIVEYLHFQRILSVIYVMLAWIMESNIVSFPFNHVSSCVIWWLSGENPAEISSNLVHIVLSSSWCVSCWHITREEYELRV